MEKNCRQCEGENGVESDPGRFPPTCVTNCVIEEEVKEGDGDGFDLDYDGDVDGSQLLHLGEGKWKLGG